MGFISIVLLAVGLAMDAFAVSICKGLAMNKLSIKNAAIIGLWFGGFQALMPAIGYFLGSTFEDKITAIDHWVGFVLLALIGVNMIREALVKDDEETTGTVGIKEMFVLAVATSIDALAVGITFAFVEMNVPLAIILIGVITFAISMLGVKIGNLFGTKYKSKAEFAGGVILIFLGLKILLEGIGVIG
ncbi:MAG: manganese efflux pump MntP family protein [Oscillospiraceae bacterium]|nr:manganese efflux pump MntP family protein [Oscillospiraceae bacterium]